MNSNKRERSGNIRIVKSPLDYITIKESKNAEKYEELENLVEITPDYGFY